MFVFMLSAELTENIWDSLYISEHATEVPVWSVCWAAEWDGIHRPQELQQTVVALPATPLGPACPLQAHWQRQPDQQLGELASKSKPGKFINHIADII